MKPLLTLAILIAMIGVALAHDDAMKVIKPDSLTWREHPVLKGVQAVVLIGDPSKSELIVQRLKFPPNYQGGPAHSSLC
jgi:hypothetical protein